MDDDLEARLEAAIALLTAEETFTIREDATQQQAHRPSPRTSGFFRRWARVRNTSIRALDRLTDVINEAFDGNDIPVNIDSSVDDPDDRGYNSDDVLMSFLNGLAAEGMSFPCFEPLEVPITATLNTAMSSQYMTMTAQGDKFYADELDDDFLQHIAKGVTHFADIMSNDRAFELHIQREVCAWVATLYQKATFYATFVDMLEARGVELPWDEVDPDIAYGIFEDQMLYMQNQARERSRRSEEAENYREYQRQRKLENKYGVDGYR